MPRKWIILDVSSIAYAAFYGTARAAAEDDDLRCIRGVCRKVYELEDRFDTRDIIFAFDRGDPIRKRFYPPYKATTPAYDSDPIRQEARKHVRRQTHLLRSVVLPKIGYKNVLVQEGYEGDDMIAAAVNGIGGNHHAVIVTTDRDLYQCLGPDVTIFNPVDEKERTEDTFRDTFGCAPSEWPRIKAIAGDPGDNIPGVNGVGETTAARFITDRLPAHTMAASRCRMWVSGMQYTVNLKLVRLPYPGTIAVRPEIHSPVTRSDWIDMIDPKPRAGIPQP